MSGEQTTGDRDVLRQVEGLTKLDRVRNVDK